jgi:hypothetical protein
MNILSFCAMLFSKIIRTLPIIITIYHLLIHTEETQALQDANNTELRRYVDLRMNKEKNETYNIKGNKEH